MRCSAGSSPRSPTDGTATCPRASSPTCARAWSTPLRWPRSPRPIGLGEWLLLGKGEDAAGGRQKPSILSDALEAVLGAVYLDGGVDAAKALVSTAVQRAARRPPPANSIDWITRPCCRS